MNSQSITNDVSGNRNNGIGHNLVLAEGPSGDKDTALAFSGNLNSYMEIRTSSVLDVDARGSFSYAGFVKLNRTEGYLWVWSNPGLPSSILIRHKRLHVFLQQHDPSNGSTNPTSPHIQLNKWLFIGVSYDYRNFLLRLKINEDDHVFAMPRHLLRTASSVVYVGKQSSEALSEIKTFRGSMSCLMLFDVALTHSDMERVRAYCLAYNAEGKLTTELFYYLSMTFMTNILSSRR
jgi:hypothetical protein